MSREDEQERAGAPRPAPRDPADRPADGDAEPPRATPPRVDHPLPGPRTSWEEAEVRPAPPSGAPPADDPPATDPPGGSQATAAITPSPQRRSDDLPAAGDQGPSAVPTAPAYTVPPPPATRPEPHPTPTARPQPPSVPDAAPPGPSPRPWPEPPAEPPAEPPEEPSDPPGLPDDVLFADLAANLETRGEEDERSYSEVVRRVDAYREQGYDLFGIAGYPSTGKTHAVKALIHRLQGFDPSARSELRRGRAPGPTEYWPFYYAYDGAAGGRWVLMDTSGDLYAQIHDNQWVEHFEAKGGLLNTISHASGLLLLVHLTRGHLDLAAAGFSDEMDDDETAREERAQRAQEELDFLDHFLLFSRALHAERGEVARLVRAAADAPNLDDALRRYRDAPKLDIPVAVLFTQADRLAEGRDFAVGPGRYLAPASLVGVAPFVARHLPTLFTTLLRHARRFRFDFVQSYVERPSPGGGVPLWSHGDEPLSVGLVPALEFLQRRGAAGRRRGFERFEVDTRTTLRLHRLLHPRLWEGVEVDL